VVVELPHFSPGTGVLLTREGWQTLPCVSVTRITVQSLLELVPGVCRTEGETPSGQPARCRRYLVGRVATSGG